MEEDKKIQQLDRNQEKRITNIHDLKQQQKEIFIIERMRSVQDMNNL
jgi:hypothetical protein